MKNTDLMICMEIVLFKKDMLLVKKFESSKPTGLEIFLSHAVKFRFHFEFLMNCHLNLGLQTSRIKDQNKRVILKIEIHN